MNDEKKAEIERLLAEGWYSSPLQPTQIIQQGKISLDPIEEYVYPQDAKLDAILAELKDMNRSLKRLAWRRN